MIQVNGLSYTLPRQGKTLIAIDSLELAAGQFHVFLGANGAGKSSLLRCLYGDVADVGDAVQLAGKPIKTYTPGELAHCRAVLPQLAPLPFAISAREIVAFGREIYRGTDESAQSHQVINTIMEWLDIAHLATHNHQRLSGGEQHRVHIARALAQIIATPNSTLDGRILFLDEPTNHLDIRHQYALMNRLQSLKACGLTIVCVLHDIALALNYADSIVLLKDAQSIGHFTPQQLVENTLLDEAYAIALHAHWSTTYRRYVVMPEAKGNAD